MNGEEGALSVIGAVSPPGGDISEPVSQATLRIVKVFWGLDSSLAYKRHFPAINWLNSYSLYTDTVADWFKDNVSEDWMDLRARLMLLLQEEAELEEIVKMVGMDALSPQDRMKLEAARSIREDYLHQNAFHETDTYTTPKHQYLLMKLILQYYDLSMDAINKGADIDTLSSLAVREDIGRFKYTKPQDIEDSYNRISDAIVAEIEKATVRRDR